MAIKPLSTIKDWFRTAKKPTQGQFWDTWDSFWHKMEKISIDAISGLQNILNNKVDVSQFDGHVNDTNNPHEVTIEQVGGVSKADLEDYQLLNEKGQANGYVPLNDKRKVPTEYLPESGVGENLATSNLQQTDQYRAYIIDDGKSLTFSDAAGNIFLGMGSPNNMNRVNIGGGNSSVNVSSRNYSLICDESEAKVGKAHINCNKIYIAADWDKEIYFREESDTFRYPESLLMADGDGRLRFVNLVDLLGRREVLYYNDFPHWGIFAYDVYTHIINCSVGGSLNLMWLPTKDVYISINLMSDANITFTADGGPIPTSGSIDKAGKYLVHVYNLDNNTRFLEVKPFFD